MAQRSGDPSAREVGAPAARAFTRPQRRLRFETVALAGLVVAVGACFWPLTRYFFAQDDFILLNRAAFTPGAAVASFFADAPGQFRPLSKGVYFIAAWRAFGLDAFPYHLVSLIVHAFNTLMVWRLFRRLRSGEAGALIGAALFGLSAAFFHVIAWISCIQQLGGMAFSLIALELGFRAIDESAGTPGGRRFLSLPALGSLAAWVLALACVEQATLLPFVFPLYAWAFGPAGQGTGEPVVAEQGTGERAAPGPAAEVAMGNGTTGRVRAAVFTTAPHWAVLLVFAAFILVWKGLPREGAYGFSLGGHVGDNLATYLGWTVDYWMRLPYEITRSGLTLDWKQVAVAALVVYHVVRGRYRQVAFALGFFLVFMLPVVFLTAHQYFLHTYMGAAGITWLVALAVRDVFDLPRLHGEDARYTALGVALVLLVTLSWYSVRADESMPLIESAGWRRSFVLRRAITAHNAYVSIKARWKKGVARQVVMVYGREDGSEDARWNNRNVIEALGRGAAIQLFYGKPQPEVEFLLLDELDEIELDRADLYFYDDHGNCFSLSEFEGRRR